MGIYPSLVTIILVVISVKRTQQAAITTDFTFSTIKRETNSDVNADSGVIISITDNAVTTNVPDTTTNDPHGTTTDTSGITSDHHGTTPESHRTTHGDTTHSDETHGGSGHGRYPVVTFNFEHVAAPYVIALWVLLASLAKIGFHLQNRLASIFPESCMLIILGVLLGLIFFLVNGLHHSLFYTLDATTFFLFLLPPIILEAGYFMPTRAFFDNIGTILTFAVIGTLWNTFAIGLCLYGLIYGGVIDLNLGFLPCMVFSSLISAVDPVAVLAVFEEIHVNEVLYIVVFGESLLNDAVTVVLYHMFETYTEMGQEEVQAVDVISGTVSFFIVGIAGLLFGVMFGLLASFVTKFTSHVRVIEPVFVFVMAMLAYYSAEIFHFSGIMALIFCGISMKKYVEQNISAKSHTTVKYFMKMLSSIMETIIFMFLGLSTVTWNHAWNTGFVFFSLLFVFIFRFIGVLGLTAVCNHFRAIQINYVDQFIMGYGGLRGAIAFCLVILLDEKVIPEKQVLVTTTIVIVYFTNFAQGITIKPIVNLLRVKKQLKFKPSLNEEINGRLMDHTNAGIEDIVGTYGSSGIRERFNHINNKYLKPLLLRQKTITRGASILSVYTNLAKHDAMQQVEQSASMGNVPRNNSDYSMIGLNGSDPTMQNSQDVVRDPAVRFSQGTARDDMLTSKSDKDKVTLPRDNSKAQRLVLEAMHSPRKRWVYKHKKHMIGEVRNHPPFHHHTRHRLRQILSKQYHKDRVTKQDDNKEKTSELDLEGKARLEVTDEVTNEVTKTLPPQNQEAAKLKGKSQSSEEGSDHGITFLTNENADASNEEQLFVDVTENNEKADIESPIPTPVSPVAAETCLPWKRNTGRPPMSSSDLHSLPNEYDPVSCQVPPWVDTRVTCVATPPATTPEADKNLNHLTVPSKDIQPPGKHKHSKPEDKLSPKSYSLPNFMQSQYAIENELVATPADDCCDNGDNLPLPWRANGNDTEDTQEPMTSPSASHDVDLRPQSSNHSFRIDQDHCAESHHSEPVNVIPLVDRRQASFCDIVPDTLLVCDDVDTCEMNPHDKINDWLSKHESDPHLDGNLNFGDHDTLQDEIHDSDSHSQHGDDDAHSDEYSAPKCHFHIPSDSSDDSDVIDNVIVANKVNDVINNISQSHIDCNTTELAAYSKNNKIDNSSKKDINNKINQDLTHQDNKKQNICHQDSDKTIESLPHI